MNKQTCRFLASALEMGLLQFLFFGAKYLSRNCFKSRESNDVGLLFNDNDSLRIFSPLNVYAHLFSGSRFSPIPLTSKH